LIALNALPEWAFAPAELSGAPISDTSQPNGTKAALPVAANIAAPPTRSLASNNALLTGIGDLSLSAQGPIKSDSLQELGADLSRSDFWLM
jgi:hypothetical protein